MSSGVFKSQKIFFASILIEIISLFLPKIPYLMFYNLAIETLHVAKTDALFFAFQLLNEKCERR
jgi:hypothetical protein